MSAIWVEPPLSSLPRTGKDKILFSTYSNTPHSENGLVDMDSPVFNHNSQIRSVLQVSGVNPLHHHYVILVAVNSRYR